MIKDTAKELALYRSIHANMNACIYILNHHPYRIEWITENDMLMRALGVSAEQAVEIGDQIPFWLENSPDFKESVQDALRAFEENPDTTWGGAYRVTKPLKEEKWIAYTVGLLERGVMTKENKYVVVAWLVDDLFSTKESMNDLVKYLSFKNNNEIIESLSNRERATLKLIAKGMTMKSIAKDMHLSHHTIEDYKKSLFLKLGCKNQVELAAKAKTIGL